MNKNRVLKKTLAAGLAVMVAGSTCCLDAGVVYASDNDAGRKSGNQETEKAENQTEANQKETKKDVDKEETVYVKAKADGSTDKVIVSDWLKNSGTDVEIQDSSDLKNIKNVKGDEAFKQDGSSLTWEANGNDIYYQGETDKPLPVEVKVTYYLDEKEISPDDLAGKSGKVRIHFAYINKSKEGEVYTPFTMVTGIILPTANFTNVKVTGGKVISDGSKNIVIGMGFPGLSDSLKLKDTDFGKDIDLPDSFDVTADATDFTLAMTATAASADTLSEFGLDKVDSFDELKDALEDMKSASEKLVDGSGDLQKGVKTLQDACKVLKDGTGTVNEKM